MQHLMAHENVELRRLPDGVLARFHEAALEIYQETAAKDPAFAKIYTSYKDYLRQVRQYHAVSEEAYYQLRELIDP